MYDLAIVGYGPTVAAAAVIRVVPAKAGTQGPATYHQPWTPAFAGATKIRAIPPDSISL
jgi:hypothetical protein